MADQSVQQVRWYAYLAKLVSLLLMPLGTVGLAAWAMNVALLRGVGLEVGAINVCTAGGFTIGGLTLWQRLAPRGAWRRRSALLGAGVLTLLGGATIALYLYNVLGTNFVSLPPAYQMSPLTAINFALLGSALLLPANERGIRLMQSLALVTLLITLQVLISYSYTAPLGTLIGYPQMSVHTAVLFLMLSSGVLLLRADASLMARVTNDGPSGMLARTLLLAVVAVPILLGWLRLLIERTRVVDPALGVTLQVMANVTVFVILVLRSARQVYRIDRHRHQIEQRTIELAAANQHLEAEINERQQAESALRFLAQASAVLGASLDERAMLQRFARLAVTTLVDGCVIDVLHENGRRERMAAEFRAATAPTLQMQAALETALHDILEQPPSSTAHVYVTADHDNEPPRPIVVLAVPLRTRDQSYGTLLLVRARDAGFASSEQALADDLGHRVAQAIDNARLYDAAQQAAQLREEFLGIAAHELKTPLSALLGNTYLLQREFARSENSARRDALLVNSISEQGWRLEKLIDALLDLSRIELRRFSIERHEVDLVALIQRAIDEQASTVHAIFVQCATPTLMISGDELRLEQVLRNLLQNAIKYSPNGGPIFVRVTEEPTHVAIAVTDHGIGIPVTAQAHLFNRFYRARNTDTLRVTGLGIGLYVVKEIVQQHGGTIEVRSTEGRGSTFTVRLPYQPDPPSVVETASDTVASSR